MKQKSIKFNEIISNEAFKNKNTRASTSSNKNISFELYKDNAPSMPKNINDYRQLLMQNDKEKERDYYLKMNDNDFYFEKDKLVNERFNLDFQNKQLLKEIEIKTQREQNLMDEIESLKKNMAKKKKKHKAEIKETEDKYFSFLDDFNKLKIGFLQLSHEVSKTQQENKSLRGSINEKGSNYFTFGQAPIPFSENIVSSNDMALNYQTEVSEKIKRVEKKFEELVKKQKENGVKKKGREE